VFIKEACLSTPTLKRLEESSMEIIIRFVLFGRKAMPTMLKSQTTTDKVVGRRLPRNRPPTHPGEMLFEEFVKPLGITQTELARRLGVSYPRLNEIKQI
jgi:hypothetical protein